MIKISVIIPVYNSEKYVKRAIESVLSQSFKNIELILVDDGSVDSSFDICNKLAALDDRIILVRKINRGVSSARNRGLELAKGEWIYFLDSDDALNDNSLLHLSKFLNSSYDLIQFGSNQIDIGKSIVNTRQSVSCGVVAKSSSIQSFLNISKIGALCVWLHVIKKEVIDINNVRFSEEMQHNEDMLFMYGVLVNSKKQIFIGEALHSQYLVPDSLSRSPMTRLKIWNRLLLIDGLFDLSSKNEHVSTIFNMEAGELLKGYFGSLRKYSETVNRDLSSFQDEYRQFYHRRKNVLKGLYAKVAAININYVVFVLRLSFYFKSFFKIKPNS